MDTLIDQDAGNFTIEYIVLLMCKLGDSMNTFKILQPYIIIHVHVDPILTT